MDALWPNPESVGRAGFCQRDHESNYWQTQHVPERCTSSEPSVSQRPKFEHDGRNSTQSSLCQKKCANYHSAAQKEAEAEANVFLKKCDVRSQPSLTKPKNKKNASTIPEEMIACEIGQFIQKPSRK